jgi:hypothetical protein
MVQLLRRPLGPRHILSVSLAIVAAVALYCFSYAALSGRSESLLVGALWGVVNIIPWFLAFEAAKRLPGRGGRAAILGAALLLSLGLGLIAYGWPAQLGFEVARRLPALLLVAGLLALIGRSRAPVVALADLPLLPGQIDWVSAAGNYVELHVGGRTIVHRASLASVEALLGNAGFVRVHRSLLVRRDAIAKVRTVDLLLHDGTSLKLGNRYRSSLGAASPPDFRPLVPAE